MAGTSKDVAVNQSGAGGGGQIKNPVPNWSEIWGFEEQRSWCSWRCAQQTEWGKLGPEWGPITQGHGHPQIHTLKP